MNEAKERLRSARESLRELGRGLSPRYRPGVEPLVIDELISPLRYDVLVRAQLFELLAAEREVFDRSPEKFVELARGTSYHTWFTLVAVESIGIAGRPTAEIEEAFERRVLRSAALADSVAAKGFIAKPPLTVRSNAGLVTAQGKRLGPRHYPLDGCHRLALLRQLGRRELQPHEYRVTDGHGPLLDNTVRLLPAIGVDEHAYVSFLAAGYVGSPVAEAEALVDAVAAEAPSRLDEVRSVLAADRPLLTEP